MQWNWGFERGRRGVGFSVGHMSRKYLYSRNALLVVPARWYDFILYPNMLRDLSIPPINWERCSSQRQWVHKVWHGWLVQSKRFHQYSGIERMGHQHIYRQVRGWTHAYVVWTCRDGPFRCCRKQAVFLNRSVTIGLFFFFFFSFFFSISIRSIMSTLQCPESSPLIPAMVTALKKLGRLAAVRCQ